MRRKAIAPPICQVGEASGQNRAHRDGLACASFHDKLDAALPPGAKRYDRFENLTSERITEANSLNIRVMPWTVNEPRQMERLVAMAVAGIITDYPNRLRRVLVANNMPLPPSVPIP